MKKLIALCVLLPVCATGLYGCAGGSGRNIDTDDGIIDHGYDNDVYDTDDGLLPDTVTDGITDGMNNAADSVNMPV